jgi:hypothetical protein
MSQCRKCGSKIGWAQRVFKGVMKWVPTNPDGSDHWDLCRERRNADLTPGERDRQRRADEKACPPFWTWTTVNGKRAVSRKKPDWWDAKAAAQTETFEEIFGHPPIDEFTLPEGAAAHLRSIR